MFAVPEAAFVDTRDAGGRNRPGVGATHGTRLGISGEAASQPMTRDGEITRFAMALMEWHGEGDALEAYIAEQGAALARARDWPAHMALIDVTLRLDEMRTATLH